MTGPVRVGIIGAGPWVPAFYVPVLAPGPETAISGIWARRPEAAAQLAGTHDLRSFESLDALFDASDAIVVAVPPDAQPTFARMAAEAGKALVLEKPLADSLQAAEELAAAIERLRVPAMLMLTNRYNTVLRERLAEARAFEAFGARAIYVSGGFLPGSPYATGWRLERGALLDVGPHIIDLAWEALGPVAEVRASGSLESMVHLELLHESGIRTQVIVSARCAMNPQATGVEIFGPEGRLEIETWTGRDTVAPTIRAELAHMTRTREPHPIGVERGLALQRVIAEAERQLRGL